MSFSRLPLNILHLLNICILYSFFSFVDQTHGLPKIGNQLAHSICEQHAKYSSLNEIQPPLKSPISLAGGEDVDDCGWYNWAGLLELEEGPDIVTQPPLFTYKKCLKSRVSTSDLAPGWEKDKFSHQMKTLTEEEIIYFATHSDDPSKNFDYFLDPILLGRPPDTENNTKVREFLAEEMRKLEWDVEVHSFEEETPLGVKKFANVIATLDPNVARRYVFACHFDTRIRKEYVFLGATDSAVPCAMLLHMAHDLKSSFDLLKENPKGNATFQFLFFDGEEALVNWTGTDNTYGSRALAQKWEKMPYPEGEEPGGTTYIDRMDMLVLLDLLGAPLPNFKNFYNETSFWFTVLYEDEDWLRAHDLWASDKDEKKYFRNKTLTSSRPADDHIHYLQRGVPIVHLIAKPFPEVWHKVEDNKEHLSFPTITNLERLFRNLAARYLHLDIGKES